VGLDHLIGCGLTEAQGPVGVTALLWCLAVDHRPLVQTETPQLGGSCVRRRQQSPDISHGCHPDAQEGLEIKGCGVSGISIELPFGAITGTLERDPGARVPPAELGRTVHVVGEKEVLNRVLARVPPPTQMRGGDGVDPGVVRGLEWAPFILSQSIRHGHQEYDGGAG